jgi:hypothetical protein
LHNIFSQRLVSQDPQGDRLDGTAIVLEQLCQGLTISGRDPRREIRVASIQIVQIELRSAKVPQC